jgi:hypothetical protein
MKQIDNNTPENASELEMESENSAPGNQTDVLRLLDGVIRSDGCVDNRTTFGQSLKSLKDLIKQDKFQAAEMILVNDVAMLSLLEKVIESYVLSNPAQMIQDNKLSPLLGVSLFRFKEAKHRALNQLLSLKKKNGKCRDLGDITFD